MALVSSNQYGSQYRWGFASTDAPNFGATFVARAADLTVEPPVVSQATDGEGMAEGTTVTKAANRKITGSFTGYVTASFSADTFTETFTWTPTGISSSSRFFVITKVSVPRRKGDYWEVTVEAMSDKLVTS